MSDEVRTEKSKTATKLYWPFLARAMTFRQFEVIAGVALLAESAFQIITSK